MKTSHFYYFGVKYLWVKEEAAKRTLQGDSEGGVSINSAGLN